MIGSLFSGIGGVEMGLEFCGLGPVFWQCDNDQHARAVLATHWPSVRRYNDVREIDETAERPEIICGGFPCQDISLAGKGAGIDGSRSGLWSEYARIVRALRPLVVFVENVAALVNRGLDRVLGDLAALGFDAEWDVFRASDVGAPHRRERLFLLAYSDGERVRQLAERGPWCGARERETEREHAESLDDRTAVADADGVERIERSSFASIGSQAPGSIGCGMREPCRHGALADTDGARRGSCARDAIGGDRSGALSVGPPEPRRRGGAVPDSDRARREGLRRGEPSGPRRTDAAELRAGDVADTNGNGCESVGGGGIFNGERPARRDDIDRRHSAHRFPPGPAAIAGWDGPQPAIRRGDDGVPGRSHRLRLLGNSVVPQQAALAWRTLTARIAQARAA